LAADKGELGGWLSGGLDDDQRRRTVRDHRGSVAGRIDLCSSATDPNAKDVGATDVEHHRLGRFGVEHLQEQAIRHSADFAMADAEIGGKIIPVMALGADLFEGGASRVERQERAGLVKPGGDDEALERSCFDGIASFQRRLGSRNGHGV
jgi:hypothetical protein